MNTSDKRAQICAASEGTPSEIGAKLLELVEDSEDVGDGDTRTDRIQLIKMNKLVESFERLSKMPAVKNINKSIYKNLNHLKFLFSCSVPFIDLASDPDPYHFKPLIDRAGVDVNLQSELSHKMDDFKILDSYESAKKTYMKDFYIYKAEEISVNEIDKTCKEAIKEALQQLDQKSTNKAGSIQNFIKQFETYLSGINAKVLEWEGIKSSILDHMKSPTFEKLKPEEKVNDILHQLDFKLEKLKEFQIQQSLKEIIKIVINGLDTPGTFIVKDEVTIALGKQDFKEHCTKFLNKDGSEQNISARIDIMIQNVFNDGAVIVEVKRSSTLVEDFINTLNKPRKDQVKDMNYILKQVVAYCTAANTPLAIISNLRQSILIILSNEEELLKSESNGRGGAVGIKLKYRIIENTDNKVTLMWGLVYMIKVMKDDIEKENFRNTKLREIIQITNEEFREEQASQVPNSTPTQEDSAFSRNAPTYVESKSLERFSYKKENPCSDLYLMTKAEFKQLTKIEIEQDLKNDENFIMKCFTFPMYNFNKKIQEMAKHYAQQEVNNIRKIESYNTFTDHSKRINVPTCYGALFVIAVNENGFFTNSAYAVLLKQIKAGTHYNGNDPSQKRLLNDQISNMHTGNVAHRDLKDSNIIYSSFEKKLYLIDWAFEDVSRISSAGSQTDQSSDFDESLAMTEMTSEILAENPKK